MTLFEFKLGIQIGCLYFNLQTYSYNLQLWFSSKHCCFWVYKTSPYKIIFDWNWKL